MEEIFNKKGRKEGRKEGKERKGNVGPCLPLVLERLGLETYVGHR
jgi:hypothetical protein